MHFKSWDDISPPPNAAEQQLKAAAEAGKPCRLGPADQIPDDPANWQTLTAAQEARHIRAEVLRLILLNGDGCDTAAKGVVMRGAYISGSLDLTNCIIPSNLLLYDCRLEYRIFAPRSKWAGDLRLKTCALPGLKAGGTEFRGQVSCEAVNFNSPEAEALNLQRAEVKGGLFLRNTTLNRSAHLGGVKVGGQMSCKGTTFNTPKGMALTLRDAEITGGLNLSNITQIRGILDLSDAKTSILVDNPHSYPPTGALILDGFTYDRIIGSTDSKTRLDWLAKGDRWNGEFFPQPYKQLAKTLHDMGHEADARQVRITLACKLRQEARAKLRITPNGDLSTGLHSIWRDILRLCLGGKDSISLLLTAHGYKPQRSLYALILLFAAATFPAQWAWDEGSFAPNSGPILLSEGWQELARDDDTQNPAAEWANRNAIPGKDWETFNRYAYAADVVIPIVEFGQTEAWAPSTERGPWGYHLWWLRWVFTTLGWIVTALGAAALTGLIRRD